MQENRHDQSDIGDRMEQLPTQKISVSIDDDQQVKKLEARVCKLEEEIKELRKGESCRFSLESIASDDSKVAFYNDFHSYDHLKCFDFLGPPASQLIPERYLTTVTKEIA